MRRLDYLLVTLGGGLGTLARYGLAEFIGTRFGPAFPWATLFVNVSGCLAIGFFATLTAAETRCALPAEWRLAFMTGVCGGYTTFSAWSLQTLELGLHEHWGRALVNIFGTVVLCLVAVWVGHMTASAINR